jgi:ABC-2 type transport system permease protein
MKAFFGFVKKEVLHILRDWRTLSILVGLPIAQMILFGFAIRNEINDVQVAIVDPSMDSITGQITNRLIASEYFTEAVRLTTTDELHALFQEGRIREAIVFQPNFGQRLQREGKAEIQLITDATEPNFASTVLSYASAIISDYQQEMIEESGGQVAPLIVSQVRMRFNPALKSVYLFVPGLVALILMLVCALMTSITITREKEIGTMEVLLVSPLKPIQIVVGKVMPYMLLSQINVLTILVLARLVFDVPIRGSIVLLLLQSLLFTICSLSLGIFISTKASTQQTAMMVSLAGLLLPTVLLSGFIFPVSSMPTVLQYVSHIVPAKWFLIIIRGIMIKGIGLKHVLFETGILAFMTFIFIIASERNFKIRLA